MVQEIQKIAQEILNSYEVIIEEVSALRKEAISLLEDTKREEESIYLQLKEFMARMKSLRKKDFDSMMAEIRNHQEKREREVGEILENFQREESSMYNNLKKIAGKGNPINIDTMKSMMSGLQNRREEERDVSEVLKDFQIEKEELNKGLKRFLDKGQLLKVRDFKAMIENLKQRQSERKTEISELTRSLARQREELERQMEQMQKRFQKEQEKLRQQLESLVNRRVGID